MVADNVPQISTKNKIKRKEKEEVKREGEEKRDRSWRTHPFLAAPELPVNCVLTNGYYV